MTEDALGWVRVAVLVGDVVVVVAPVVVVPPPVVEVVDVGRVSVPKSTTPTPRSPAWSPMAIAQSSPAACWAAVGGHGKLAASVTGVPDVVHPGMGPLWPGSGGLPLVGSIVHVGG